MKLGEVVAAAKGTLALRRIPDPEAEAEFLAAGLFGLGRLQVRLEADRRLTPGQARKFQAALARRLRREPLAYILGNQPFFDLDLKVKPGVFIPRPETEELVHQALEVGVSMLAGRRTQAPELRILDLCSGSGAIAIALSKRLPASPVTAVEISPGTLAVARANAARNGVQVRFLKGDLFAPLSRRSAFDIIVSNPPYIRPQALARLAPEVRREPRRALDGGRRGLAILERIVAQAPAFLRPGGALLLEMDPGQTGTVGRLLRERGFGVEVKKDFREKKRIVIGRHPSLSASERPGV